MGGDAQYNDHILAHDPFRTLTDSKYGMPSETPNLKQYWAPGNIDTCPYALRNYYYEKESDDHGTHVASIAAGKNVGVANGARIIPVRVFDSLTETTALTIIDALNWVIQTHVAMGLPSVVNMSLGGTFSFVFDDVMQAAIAAGLVLVVSAGNENQDAFYCSPAGQGANHRYYKEDGTPFTGIYTDGMKLRIETTFDYSTKPITVGASSRPVVTPTTGDKVWYWNDSQASNWGDVVDIYAPGDDIYAASVALGQCFTNYSITDAYATKTGTSMAAPFISGVCALLLSQNRTMDHKEIRTLLMKLATNGAFASDELTHLRRSNEFYGGIDSLLNPYVSSTNKLLYSYYTESDLKWISTDDKFQMSIKENKSITVKVRAESIDSSNEPLPIEYFATMKDGSPVPSYIVVNTEFKETLRIGSISFGEYWANVRITAPAVSHDTIMEPFLIIAKNGKNPDITHEFTYTITNVSQPPVWITPRGNLLTETWDGRKTIFYQNIILSGEVKSKPLSVNESWIKLMEVDDPDRSGIRFTILSGQNSLPPGLTFDPLGNFVGKIGVIPKTSTMLKRYDIVVRATNGNGLSADQYFYLDGESTDSKHYFKPSWLSSLFTHTITTDQGNRAVKRIYIISRSSSFSQLVEVENTDNDKLSFSILPIAGVTETPKTYNGYLPLGLKIDDSGKIVGVPGENADLGTYIFTIRVTDSVGYSIEGLFSIVVTNNSSGDPGSYVPLAWETPAGNIGIMWETYPCHAYVKATTSSKNKISYRVVAGSGQLPSGLYLDEYTGYILGNAPLVELDSEYTFTIRARCGSTFLDRTFSIIVKDFMVNDPMVNIKARLMGNDRKSIGSWSWMSNILPDELMFKPGDENFGRVKYQEMYILGGLKNMTTGDIINKLRDFHHKMDFRLGSLKVAIARDPIGNHIYDVLYYDIIDPQDRAGGFDSKNKESPVDTGLKLPEIRQWNIPKGSSIIYPNSIQNIRKDFLFTDQRSSTDLLDGDGNVVHENPENRGTGVITKERLPLWMMSQQVKGVDSSIPGFQSALVIGYMKPNQGAAAKSLLEIQGINDDLSGMPFTVDRYYISYLDTRVTTRFDIAPNLSVDGSGIPLEYQWDDFVRMSNGNPNSARTVITKTSNAEMEFENPHREFPYTDGVYTDLPPTQTLFDVMNLETGKYIKFPPGDK